MSYSLRLNLSSRFHGVFTFSWPPCPNQWRHTSWTSARISNGAVQPPLHRTPRAVAVSESFGSFEGYEVVLDVLSEKFEFGLIFGSPVAFSIRWRKLTGQSRAPVNWDRWAAPDEQMVYSQNKPNCSRSVEHSECLSHFCPHVFWPLWWRERCQIACGFPTFGLFRIRSKFAKVLCDF